MIGRVLGNYEVIEKIGEGGMGEVYRAIDTTIEREVAIKVLRSQLTANDQLVSRFRGEAVALAKLHHPNIAMLYGFFRHEEIHFMALEYISGERLDKRIKRFGKMPFNEAIRVFSQVLGAIGYAHRRKIIHRDIKPNNIIIAEGEEVKVMDFGIARVVGSERITREGLIVGTLEYMAPEQIRGKEPSPQTDIYALGVLLYEMFAGRLPFTCQTDYEMIRAHIELAPRPLREFAPNLPAYVENAVMRALEKKPEERFKDTDDFRNALFTGVTTIPVIEPGMIVPDQTESQARTTDETRKSASTGMAPLPRDTSGKVGEQMPKAGASQTSPDTDSRRETVITPRANEPTVRQSNMSLSGSIHPVEAPVIPPIDRDEDKKEKIKGTEKAPRQSPWMTPRLLFGILGGLVLVLAIYIVLTSINPNGKKPDPPTPATFQPEKMGLIEIKGGTFRMGRAGSQPPNEQRYAYALMQWPPSSVPIKTFWIDRTEVTNQEYGQFVKDTGHLAPPDWKGQTPPLGREKWPVTNVTYDDAEKFAKWRCSRDHIEEGSYRLPFEEEWEYAARKDSNSLYPWGDDWRDGFANVRSTAPMTVAQLPQDRSPWGAMDMLGNVAEWTASTAKMYPGSTNPIKSSYAGFNVIRGGSYLGKPDGELPGKLDGQVPICLTFRNFVDPKRGYDFIGFRLVYQAR